MDDDDRLGPLFRAAADAGAPAAAFDHGDVLAASRRVAARRRGALVTAVVLVLASVGIGSAVLLPARSEDLTAAPASAPELPVPDSSAESDRLFGDTSASGAADPDATATDPLTTDPLPPDPRAPLGAVATECAPRPDPALRALLEQALPEVAGAPEALSDLACLPGRHVGLEVDDGGARGVLGVGYLPPGVEVVLAPGAVAAPTASGGTAIVSSRPAEPGGVAPFAVRLGPVLGYLASRL